METQSTLRILKALTRSIPNLKGLQKFLTSQRLRHKSPRKHLRMNNRMTYKKKSLKSKKMVKKWSMCLPTSTLTSLKTEAAAIEFCICSTRLSGASTSRSGSTFCRSLLSLYHSSPHTFQAPIREFSTGIVTQQPK